MNSLTYTRKKQLIEQSKASKVQNKLFVQTKTNNEKTNFKNFDFFQHLL